jgi:hypothetical protein
VRRNWCYGRQVDISTADRVERLADRVEDLRLVRLLSRITDSGGNGLEVGASYLEDLGLVEEIEGVSRTTDLGYSVCVELEVRASRRLAAAAAAKAGAA